MINRADLPVIDMSLPEFWRDPHPVLAGAREESIFAVLAPGDTLCVLRHAEISDVLHHPELKMTNGLESLGIVDGVLHDFWDLVMFSNNGETHARLRSLVTRALTPKKVAALRPRIHELAAELIQEALEVGRVDFVEAVAHLLPLRVTCELLGVPIDERDAIAEHTCTIGRAFTPMLTPEARDAAEASVLALQDLIGTMIEERRSNPQDDLMTGLVMAEHEGDRLSPEELSAMVINLLFAGHDTTRGYLSYGMRALLEYPGLFDRLCATPDLAPHLADEMIRFESPAVSSLRVAATDIELFGLPVGAGEIVQVVFPAGNRDPRVYDDPDTFVPERFANGAPRSLSYGVGPHYCVGAALARSEMEEMLRALAELCSSIALDLPEGQRPEPVPYQIIRQLESLPVQLLAR